MRPAGQSRGHGRIGLLFLPLLFPFHVVYDETAPLPTVHNTARVRVDATRAHGHLKNLSGPRQNIEVFFLSLSLLPPHLHASRK